MEKIRLSKRMSELGLCSRREADVYIEKGWVEVDGEIVSQLGTKVVATQKITLRTAAQNTQQQRVTILINKPVSYVSGQAEHNYKPASVLFEAENHWVEDSSPLRFHRSQHLGLAPAGRLDIDSQGLLVLTQDGRVAKRLIGEDSPVDKEYLVRVQGKLDDSGLALLCQGLKLDGEYLKQAKVSWQNEDQLRFVLREGKKRQIRRMCELVGLKVTGLKRIRIGKVKLGNLPVGQWRYLGENEQF
jgi:23S rRNA pseudouridine2604 synthase